MDLHDTQDVSKHHLSRRRFMQAAAATASAAALAGQLAPRTYANGSSALRVGLIGCGGRGGGAAVNALRADPNAKLVAMADLFPDRLQGCLNSLLGSDVAARVVVDAEHQLAGFDGYKGVIESCDVVLLAAPPHFRPRHIRAAVDAGRHVFAEKPVAVDPVGVRAVLEACRIARQKNLNVVSGLCYRYQFAKQQTVQRIHDGLIGDIVALQTTYNGGALWHRGRDETWTDMEYQLRNWYYYAWLSGDFIVEQHVHSLDKIAWVMRDEYPTRCTASGGRTVRTSEKWGNIYDHFNTVYEWPSGVKCFSSCRQWQGAAADVSDHVFGSRGTAHLQSHRIDLGDGSRWRYRHPTTDDMYQNEHNALFKAIANNETINNGEYMCKSTLLAIMARMSAYTGQTVEFDWALNESQLDLTPPAYELGPAPATEIPVPGSTSLI